jgi:predicted aldo/keto reductase-like oxidoreductase
MVGTGGQTMHYKTLGRTGLRVSVIGLGTMVHAGHFGPMKDEESLAAIDTALELGVNFIDTSDAYGAGYSEHCSATLKAARQGDLHQGAAPPGRALRAREFLPEYRRRAAEV